MSATSTTIPFKPAVKSMSVPCIDLPGLHAPLRAEILEAVGCVVDHGQFVLGPEVAELEARWALLCETRHAVAVGSGTDALVLLLCALGIKERDEVITTPNSFLASASAVLLAGAKPRFADVGADFNLDPDTLHRSMTDRTRAILVVHLTGRPADMEAINDFARAKGLMVLEDAAQAIGARYRGRAVGSLALAAGFSLHPIKNLGACGDAGMITTDDDDLADRLRRLRNHGMTHRQEDCSAWGHNSRMDTMQAAIALVKLNHLPTWTARRRAIAARYRRRLRGLVRMPADRPDDVAVYHTFPVEVEQRDALIEHLGTHGVTCAVHYRRPIHLLPCAEELGYRAGDFPVAEAQAGRLVSLPISPTLSDEQIDHVCDLVEAFFS